MKYFGHDSLTKHLFSWDGDFTYEGKSECVPEGAFIVTPENRSSCEMIGALFLSGNPSTSNILKSDSEGKIVKLPPGIAGCLYGSVCDIPSGVSIVCRQIPSDRVYVCPLVEELASFGVLVICLKGKAKPRRVPFCKPNYATMEGKAFEFDSKLEGDGYGIMANAVAKGRLAINEMMTSVGISPFYGRVLSKRVLTDESVFIIRCDAMNKYFPMECISIKSYAATSVPVRIKNTNQFREASGCDDEEINIVVATDYIPMLPSFMNFYQLMSGMDFVVATKKNRPDFSNLPVFRYDKAYNTGTK